ncbi:hypothetical protein CARUB_v10022010mg [Capsella rubella]|uniref:NAC domain-containing protein n=1 Tax=Capsella rubella TaxID=81985 RepID=R0I8R2_9BRAS|nr:uncharacterized protein LOC17895568 [Capsella rubella]EOA34470.1 hypothetical protein CARUB_v10022010mg [Capsella rubella]
MEPIRNLQSIEDEIVATYLKMIIGDVSWPRRFLRSQDVYCKNPMTFFANQAPMILHDGRYLIVNRSLDSGKTDGCESGCWRVIGRDKLIKSEKTGKILGFKKVYKFCEKEEPRSVFKFWEKEKRRVRDKRVWVMEEYRLASTWTQGYVICKIRLLNPNPLEFMLCNHVRGYYV